jgi:hypothetical protein
MTASEDRTLLRHMVATLAYRAAKVLRDAPEGFGSFAFDSGRRTPVGIVAHLGDLMTWACHMADGHYRWAAEGSTDWDREVTRFFERLAELDQRLSQEKPLGYPPEILIQGPLADALTHVGQLSMLRGAAGSPVRPESYARAEIVIGRVGPEQAPPGKEFDGDASERR